MSHNPWVDAHIEAEVALQGGDRGLAQRLVMNEYAEGEAPLPCPCGGTLFYKATIGAMKCPSCGQLADCNGDLF